MRFSTNLHNAWLCNRQIKRTSCTNCCNCCKVPPILIQHFQWLLALQGTMHCGHARSVFFFLIAPCHALSSNQWNKLALWQWVLCVTNCKAGFTVCSNSSNNNSIAISSKCASMLWVMCEFKWANHSSNWTGEDYMGDDGEAGVVASLAAAAPVRSIRSSRVEEFLLSIPPMVDKRVASSNLWEAFSCSTCLTAKCAVMAATLHE